MELLYEGVCQGDGPYERCWVTTYLWARPEGQAMPALTMEQGIAADWHTEAQMCDPAVTPYTRYHRTMFEALRQKLAAPLEAA